MTWNQSSLQIVTNISLKTIITQLLSLYTKEMLSIAQVSRQAGEQEKLFSKADATVDDRIQKEGWQGGNRCQEHADNRCCYRIRSLCKRQIFDGKVCNWIVGRVWQRATAEGTSFPTLYHDKEETIKESIQLFNQQRYWECHEALEQIWRRETNPIEKALQQGVILSASALVHAQKDEDAICIGMIPSALTRLNQWKEGSYYSLNVDLLKRSMEEILKSGKITYPKI